MLLQSLSDPLHAHFFIASKQEYPYIDVNGDISNRVPMKKAGMKKPARIAVVTFILLLFY